MTAFMAWPPQFNVTLTSCTPLGHLPVLLICGDNAPAANTHEPMRLFQKRFVPWAATRFVADSKLWWELEGSSQRNCVGLYLDELLGHVASEEL